MTVLEHESTSKDKLHGFCYGEATDTLQYSKEVLNNLDTLTRNNDIPMYKYFEEEMEKIDAGDTSNVSAVKLDEYFGSIGLPEEPEKVEKRRKIHGIC